MWFDLDTSSTSVCLLWIAFRRWRVLNYCGEMHFILVRSGFSGGPRLPNANFNIRAGPTHSLMIGMLVIFLLSVEKLFPIRLLIIEKKLRISIHVRAWLKERLVNEIIFIRSQIIDIERISPLFCCLLLINGRDWSWHVHQSLIRGVRLR